MATKTPADNLSAEIASILQDYGNEVYQHVDEAVKQVTKAGVKAIKAASKKTFGGTGAYAKGWTYTAEKKGRSTKGIIYNGDLPGLVHLLEDGHLNQDGSRTPGRPHVGPVAEQITQDFTKEVEKTI